LKSPARDQFCAGGRLGLETSRPGRRADRGTIVVTPLRANRAWKRRASTAKRFSREAKPWRRSSCFALTSPCNSFSSARCG